MKRERKFRTFRLRPDEKLAIRKLTSVGARKRDRHMALLELVSLVPTLDLPKVDKSKREPMRLGIPSELDAAINKVKHQTGHTYVSILLAAVHRRLELDSKPNRRRSRNKKA